MNKYIFLPLLALFCACTEDKRPEIRMDDNPPQSVSGVNVINIPGGAVLRYQLPDDEDLLYVKAVYSYREGHRAEARSSLYCDSLKILGFGTEDERSVELVAVDRSKNESTPVKVLIKPLEAPVNAIGKTVKMIPDFGGVHLYWHNPDRAEIAIILEKEDHNDEFVPVEAFYSTVVNGDVAARGMDTIPENFRVYVQDRWENRSAVTEDILTPLFEQQFDRTKFKTLFLEGDEPDAFGWVLSNVFDGDLTTGFHTGQGLGHWPQWFSFDMGVVGKISRIKLWQRGDMWPFRHGNPKRYEIWGTNDAARLNDWDAWIKMIECESIKPSGLPVGQNTDEDNALVAAGEEFACPAEMPAVRYLRMKVLENWSGGDFVHFMEFAVYGQIIE